jgi:hypothetical protein
MSLQDLTILLMVVEERERRERREERERFEYLQYLQQQQQQNYGTFDYARRQQQLHAAHLQLRDDEDQARHEAREVPRTMKCPGCDGVGSAWRVSRSYFRSHTYDTCAQCGGRGTLEVSVESPKLVARKRPSSVFSFYKDI